MHPLQKTPNPISSISSPSIADEPALPPLTKRAKDFIAERLARGHPPEWVAAGLRAYFEIEITPAQVIPWARGEIPPPVQTETTQMESRQDKESPQFPADAEGEPLFTRMPGAEDQDAAATDTVNPDAVNPLAVDPRAQNPDAATDAAPATRTGHGQNKASMQIPTEAPTDIAAQCMAHDDPPAASTAAPRTGAGPEKESAQIESGDEIVPDEVREYIIARMARHSPPWLIAQDVQAKFQFALDRDEIVACWRDRDLFPTRMAPGQEKSQPKLNDEIREFIVKRLACYETPSRVAAAVRTDFGIDIDRRRVFDYDPAGSRPPAQRWIDLHAATRARFLRDVGEIGIAQKTIRLRTLERLADMAEENNRHDRAAKYLEQAAKECGGFYERWRRLNAAAPAN